MSYEHLHAHMSRVAVDCDGRYESRWVMPTTKGEQASDYGDHEFKERMISTHVNPLAAHGLLTVTPEGYTWTETLEEGYVTIETLWCEVPGCRVDRS